MNKCLNCGKEVKNKYCNVSCQNKHQNQFKIIKKWGEIKEFKVNCFSCEKEIIIKEREKLFPKKEKYYCSINCSNKRKHSILTKEKISESLKIEFLNNPRKKKIINSICLNCGEKISSYKERIFCSKNCKNIFYIKNGELINWATLGGKKSTLNQNRRSKNEIYFSELCLNIFDDVKLNTPIFNGWDADIILTKYKLAIMWNGNWHYKKIGKKHSLFQVQNRDKIKIKEIKNFGYTPYIIKDPKGYNKKFVENEFEKLKIYLNV